ncbi:unnamed protein product [Durusdinium trenchii]|uniref:D-lactate dehydrogenase membrane binding C-terminal domain-containing protein n=1 Tax=Durusdinium trenchii TaxID=1381693 RepID=A0ABP0JRM4_9DINO
MLMLRRIHLQPGLMARHVSSKPGKRSFSLRAVCGAGLVGCGAGYLLSRMDGQLRERQLPGAGFRVCCEEMITPKQQALPNELRGIVGKQHVVENVTEICHVAILPQGAKTGITGGSVPRPCDRPMVVISTQRLQKILPIGDEAKQVLCFAGAGIFSVQETLKPLNRDSHSVLGSIFLNPSVAAGVAFGSGGTQIHKGPAFTNRALYCRVDANGQLKLVNTLGLNAHEDVVAFLDNAQALSSKDMDAKCTRAASWPKYPQHLTKLDGQVSRYNADLTGEDCNRSEGKVFILATIHDTFPMPQESKMVWVSCKDFATANHIKQKVALASPNCLPKQFEYMGREQFDCVDQGGRGIIKLIEMVGMSNLGTLWNFKLKFESLPLPFVNIIADKLLWYLNSAIPESLPKPLMEQGRKFDHHLIMEMTEFGNGELKQLDERLQRQLALNPGDISCYVCQDAFEKSRVMLFRFAVQPSIQTITVGKGRQGLIIDYAMPKNFDRILEMPKDCDIEMRCLCSHFGCNVFHESLMLSNDVDVKEVKKRIKQVIDEAGGKLPAEHGHGTEYEAPCSTQERWKRIDPTNSMNPGVGHSSSLKGYL